MLYMYYIIPETLCYVCITCVTVQKVSFEFSTKTEILMHRPSLLLAGPTSNILRMHEGHVLR